MNAFSPKPPGPSNLFPAPGLNRVWRWVEPGTLPGTRLVAIFDHTKNLMVIDKVKFAGLSSTQQEQLMKSNEPVYELEWVPG